MANNRLSMTRRRMASALAASSLGFAQRTVPGGGKPAIEEPTPPGKRPLLKEALPFDEPLEFRTRRAPMKLTAFPLSQVRLLSGACLQASEWNRAYMGRLGVDRLLHNFRVNAGMASSAKPLGGWESPRSELRGHFTGHYLSACALRWGGFGDAEMKARGEEMVRELRLCQSRQGGGYLSAFPVEHFDRLAARKGVWAPFYTLHKILAGLLDMFEFAGSKDALKVAWGLAEWVDAWTAARGEKLMQDILRTEYGGMNDALYRLAALTGDDRWGEVGDRFTKRAFLRPLASRRDELRDLHANTHIPQVIGAARRYEQTGDDRFGEVARFFHETIRLRRTYSTGGSGNVEAWLTDAGRLALELRAASHHQECCCAYNMMKLTRHLYAWSGDARLFDYYERNLLNHRLGAIQPETGHSIYFLSLMPGAWKTLCTEDATFWCCTGTAIEEYSKLADSIYWHDGQDVYANLFVASELDWRERDLMLRQETKIPDESETTFTIVAAPAAPWTLNLRIPIWAAGATARVNGKQLEAMASPGSYLKLKRAWNPGDSVELSLPMRLSSEATPDDASLQSFLCGPVVLAAELGKAGLSEELIRNRQGPAPGQAPMEAPRLRLDQLKPDGRRALGFTAATPNGPLALSPISAQWQRFAVYFNTNS